MFIQTLNKLLCVYFWTWWHSKACWTNCTGSCVRGSYVAFQHANFSAWNVLFFPVIHTHILWSSAQDMTLILPQTTLLFITFDRGKTW